MKLRHLLLSGAVLIVSGWLLTACSLNTKTPVVQTVPSTNTPQQDQVEEAQLEQPKSDSTNIDDLDAELSDFKVLEEDFSNL